MNFCRDNYFLVDLPPKIRLYFFDGIAYNGVSEKSGFLEVIFINMDYDKSYDVGDFFATGSFDIKCDPILYENGRITLDYRIHSKCHSKDLSEILSFIQKNYRKAYSQVLAGVFSAYRNNPKWDVWIEEANNFLRIDFTEKEELHPYIGIPTIDLAFCGGKIFWGMTFSGGTNKLSYEHGFCTVFEQEKLLVLADSDFSLILKWWDYYYTNGNILKTSSL